MYKKFSQNDIFYSTIKAYPTQSFFIWNNKIYYDFRNHESGSFTNTLNHVPTGSLSLYELNVDRPSTSLIYPFLVKGESQEAFRTVSSTQFDDHLKIGDTITGSYPYSASIERDYYAANSTRPKIVALQNVCNQYQNLSHHYRWSGSYSVGGNKSTQELSIISIPSIFYGNSIKKGTINLKFYITGTLVGQAQDLYKNGELVQTNPVGSPGSGSVVGLALYNEGFLFLTGGTDLSSGEFTEAYVQSAAAVKPSWIHFVTTASNVPSSSFEVNFQGETKINTITMFAHMKKGEMNWSNNPTFIKHGQSKNNAITSSTSFKESDNVYIKNIAKSPFTGHTASFEKITFVDSVGIYDENKNLLGVAKIVNPLRKREKDFYTIKLKLDI